VLREFALRGEPVGDILAIPSPTNFIEVVGEASGLIRRGAVWATAGPLGQQSFTREDCREI
jgi:hypothetical protein